MLYCAIGRPCLVSSENDSELEVDGDDGTNAPERFTAMLRHASSVLAVVVVILVFTKTCPQFCVPSSISISTRCVPWVRRVTAHVVPHHSN